MNIETTYHKKRIHNYLNAISPVSTEQKEINISALYEFILVFFLLILIKPVFLAFVSIQSMVEIAFVSSIIFIGLGWLYYSYTAKKIILQDWTYFDDISRFLLTLILTSFVYLFYMFYAIHFLYKEELKLNNWNFERNIFIEIIPYILIIGIFVYVLLKFIDYLKFSKHTTSEYNDEKLKNLPVPEINDNENLLILYGKNRDEKIILNLEDFLYLESYGHYTKVYINNDSSEPQVKILRNSISNVIYNMNNYSSVCYCHRSYIINMNRLNKIDGNSKKSFLTLTGSACKIPLSRRLYHEIKNKKNSIA